MKKIFSGISRFLVFCAVFSYSVCCMAYKGIVLNSAGEPIAGAVISSVAFPSVVTNEKGEFEIPFSNGQKAEFTISHEGYYAVKVQSEQTEVVQKFYLIESSRSRYSGEDNSIARKDFSLGSIDVEAAMADQTTGLQVVKKSGMTGEGAYLALRGVHTLYADNAPLVVINGMPYMPDKNESRIIGGYSRSIFAALNNQDIRSIKVLKGAEAALYGSLGSNGVIAIETDAASKESTNTKIYFNALYGMNWNSKRLPLMEAADYKSYLSDIALTRYDNMESFFNDFTFLTDPDANGAYLYSHNTNWQDEIYRNSKTMDFLFRVEGGDQIAKYNISLGFTKNDGTIKGTYSDRYSAQINTSILASRKFEINTNINLAYLRGQYQEQGLSLETNPIMAAYRRSPLLSPYSSDIYGNLIDKYSSYYYGNITNSDFIVSNPLSLVESLQGKGRQYDVNAKVALTYTPLTSLRFTGEVGMYYNYNQEQIFIPGKNLTDIVYLFDQYGQADNTVRIGTDHTFNLFWNLHGEYSWSLGQSKGKVLGGFQSVSTSTEYDAASGRNTANDFYQTLSDVQSVGRYFSGYNDKWNWASFFAKGEWTFSDLLRVSANVSLDRSSSTGADASKWYGYAGGEAVLMAKSLLKGMDFANRLDVYANIASTGNSRYSSKYARYYYTSSPYQDIAGIVRGNIPNTELKPERSLTTNLGIRTAWWANRLMMDVGYYNIKSTDVLLLTANSSVFGKGDFYSNQAEVTARGVEVSLAVTPVITNSWKWTLGGNLTTLSNRLPESGQQGEGVVFDGYYGYQTDGVYATSAEAAAANLTNENGISYAAGDVRFIDQNSDGIINSSDCVNLGNASPSCYGNFFTRLEKTLGTGRLALDLNFSYSLGAKLYNAVRQITESGSDFSNQSTALKRRWSMEGQQTDIPRVSWGDKVGNNALSDRWIEDGDYLKLRSVTLSYDFEKNLFNFIQGATVYVTGENLVCFTRYLGLDPEFSYSYSSALQGVDYGKATSPRSVKFGINFRF